MNKKEIIQVMKEDILRIGQEINEYKYQDSIEKLELVIKYSKILLLKENMPSTNLAELAQIIGESNILESSQEDEEIPEMPMPKLPLAEEYSLENTQLTFCRARVGGWIKNEHQLLDADLFVPESIVRSIGLVNGDLVRLEEKDTDSKHQTYPYNVFIEGNNGLDDGQIEEFNFGIVELDYKTNHYFVERNINAQTIGYQEGDQFVIPESVVRSHDIVSDDIVDIAYRKGDFASAKIRWKYDTGEIEKPATIEQRIRHSSVEKETIKPVEEHQVKYDLEGKKILLIGMDIKNHEFRDYIKENKGSIQFHNKGSGKKWIKNLKASIARVDVVIIAQRQVSHAQSIAAVNAAKELNKPFATYTSYGREALLDSVVSALEKGMG